MSTRQARRRQQRVRQRGKPSRAATPWYLEGRALAGVAAAIVIVIVLIVVLGQSSKPAAFVLKTVPATSEGSHHLATGRRPGHRQR